MRSLKWHKLRFKIAVKMALLFISMPFLIFDNKSLLEMQKSLLSDFDKLKTLK